MVHNRPGNGRNGCGRSHKSGLPVPGGVRTRPRAPPHLPSQADAGTRRPPPGHSHAPSPLAGKGRDGASQIASLRTSAATEKPPHRSIDRPALPLRIEPQRIQLPAQPGELALGQLAGGGDGALTELRDVAYAVEVLPG